jgi:NAD(P)-dependent dehydrogenase (short-subunit alcohol dehydrogenase family)
VTTPVAAGMVVVVTGASSGIGRATAQALAEQGARLVLSSRSDRSLERAAARCRASGAEVLTVVADVVDEDDVERLRAAATERFGRIDGWVHTAAVVAYGRFEDVPSATFRRVLDTNVHGSVHVARAALRQFGTQGEGTLVLTGSLLGEIATPYMSSYVVSKWAVRGLARVLAIEARATPGIRVCVVSPGAVNTPIYVQAANYAGRAGRPPPPVDRPEKVAAAILRSLSDGRPRRSVGLAGLVARLGFTAAPWLFDVLVGPLMRAAGLSGDHLLPHEGNVFVPKPDGDDLYGQWQRH